MDRSIIKTGIPAAVLASVLAVSMLFPAAASQGNRHGDDGHKCGYGAVGDLDENDHSGDSGGGGTARAASQSAASALRGSDKSDRDCGEDEDDGGDGGGANQAVHSDNLASIVDVDALGNGGALATNRRGGKVQ